MIVVGQRYWKQCKTHNTVSQLAPESEFCGWNLIVRTRVSPLNHWNVHRCSLNVSPLIQWSCDLLMDFSPYILGMFLPVLLQLTTDKCLTLSAFQLRTQWKNPIISAAEQKVTCKIRKLLKSWLLLRPTRFVLSQLLVVFKGHVEFLQSQGATQI